MPLVYLPDRACLFSWGADPLPQALSPLREAGEPASALLVTPEGTRETSGRALPLLDTLQALALTPAQDLVQLSGSLAVWVLASKLVMDLVARERVVPTLVRHDGRMEARWACALSSPDDAAKVRALALSMPPAAHAAARKDGVWAPDALLRAYLDAAVDALVRSTREAPRLPALDARGAPWAARFQDALRSERAAFEASGFGERSVVDALTRWSEPALGARDRLRACFRLELPEQDGAPFLLRFLLQSPDDPSLLVPADEVWQSAGGRLEKLGRAFRQPQESLLEALGRAARLFAPLARSLEEARPSALTLEPAMAWQFLHDGAALLSDAGFGVIVPAELTRAGERRLRLRMRVGGKSAHVAGVVAGSAGLSLDALLEVDWQAVIGDTALSPEELRALAAQKAPLVQFRGAWVAIDPGELGDIQRRVSAGASPLTVRDALPLLLAEETRAGTLPVAVTASGAAAELLERLRQGEARDLTIPAALKATLRPYQARGLSWLSTMGSFGLGACLADDMGLGKTMQLLALLLRRRERHGQQGPALLVAPTSVLGNWERETSRFAPSLAILRHYGAPRPKEAAALQEHVGLVLTSYGVLRRDAALLSTVDFSVVALDEAQNIKNAASATAQAARALCADQRIALTGTPVENRLAELWSILEYANPGLLGTLGTFRKDFAVPIERYGSEAAAEKLKRVVGPFILRRLKSDPAVISDLPPKHEMKVVCTLTREQATLYKAVVDAELLRIAAADGMERRGRVLALLTYTKQICNHPAQYLGERAPLSKRSGKLARVTEMLEEALAAGDKALVFTQFRDMGDKLVAHLSTALGCEVLFLHGGTPKKARDELVRRFQEEPHGARVFVLSVKAGGTGLNLTAASHVFHYDRWWNPAVEDQATDRAYRIGQTQSVQVHKLMCAGTVEEKVDALLTQKRALSAKVIGAGEQWITELDGPSLSDLFSLSPAFVADDEAEPAAAPRKRSRKAAS